MNAVSIDMAAILNADSDLGLTQGLDLHVSELPDTPDTPDRCVAVYDSGGFDEEHPSGTNPYERPTFQVRVRGARGAFPAAADLARAIRAFLSPRAGFTVSGTRYIGVFAMGDLNFLGYDEKRRPLLTMNFRALRTE